jgi:DNA-binding NtrC family response regulator
MGKKQKFDIFIVDDNKVFSLALKADIESALHNSVELHLFETGEQCMEKFKEVLPEIVILDYYLDGSDPNAVNGIEVLDRIKKENPKTNVIMLTNNDDLDVAVKAKQHGAADYVVKTETKFKKINFSLFNIFKLLESEQDLKNTKQFIYLFVGILAIILLIVLALRFVF